jgi:hypothetical protein
VMMLLTCVAAATARTETSDGGSSDHTQPV